MEPKIDWFIALLTDLSNCEFIARLIDWLVHAIMYYDQLRPNDVYNNI